MPVTVFFLFVSFFSSLIELIATKAAYWKGEETGFFHGLVVFVLVVTLVITLIDGIAESLKEDDEGKAEPDNKYGIRKISLLDNIVVNFIAVSFCIVVIFMIIALISLIFFHVSFLQALVTLGQAILILLGVNVGVLIVVCIAQSFVNKSHNKAIEAESQKETQAHTIWDPIMLEAVNKGGIVDKNHVRDYCINKTTTQNHTTDMPTHLSDNLEEIFGNIFAGSSSPTSSVPPQTPVLESPSPILPWWEFFVPDGLEALVQNDLITQIVTKQKVNDKLCDLTLYKTKNPSKIHEVSEEISLDDD